MCPRGPGRDLYLILKGEARAEVNGEVVRTRGAGDFFGELAALNWGPGYGYTRLATVFATSPARLVVVPPDVFNRLIREVRDFERRIGEAVRERLPRSLADAAIRRGREDEDRRNPSYSQGFRRRRLPESNANRAVPVRVARHGKA